MAQPQQQGQGIPLAQPAGYPQQTPLRFTVQQPQGQQPQGPWVQGDVRSGAGYEVFTPAGPETPSFYTCGIRTWLSWILTGGIVPLLVQLYVICTQETVGRRTLLNPKGNGHQNRRSGCAFDSPKNNKTIDIILWIAIAVYVVVIIVQSQQ